MRIYKIYAGCYTSSLGFLHPYVVRDRLVPIEPMNVPALPLHERINRRVGLASDTRRVSNYGLAYHYLTANSETIDFIWRAYGTDH